MGRVRRLSGLLAVVCGKVLAQGSLLACNVIVARVAGPQEFGFYAAALGLVLILDACAGSPLDYTVIRFGAMGGGTDGRGPVRVQALAFRIKLALASILALAAWALGPLLAERMLHDPSRASLLWAAAAAVAGLLLFRGTATFLQAQGRFRAYAVLDGLSGALRITAVTVAALAGLVQASAYLGALALAYAVLVAGAAIVLPQPYLTARLPSPGERAAMLRFLAATAGSIILGTISGRADILFLAASVPPDALSAYAAAAQLASVATLLAGYASLTAQPSIIPALRQGRGQRLLFEGLAAGAVLGGLFWTGACLTGDALPALLFGPSVGGARSGGLFAILAAGTAVDLVCMPVAMTYVLQLRPRAALSVEAALTGVFLAGAVLLSYGDPVHMPEHMALLATALRIGKAAIYVGMTVIDWAGRPGLGPDGVARVRRSPGLTRIDGNDHGHLSSGGREGV